MIRRSLSIAILTLALPGLALAAVRPEPPNPGDDEMLQMARALPGFGGLFYDAEGYPNVYLRDPAAPAALSTLKSLGSEVRVRQGDYDFAQLVEWKRALRPALLGQPGVVFLDADEASNRIVVGLDASDTARAKSLVTDGLDKALAAQGVPAAAVVYRDAPAFHDLAGVQTGEKRGAPTVTIQSAIRPAPGGVQMIFLQLPYAFFCTSSFNAYLGGAYGFVTNSHCTDNRGQVDGTQYTQGSDPFGAVVATEIADPAYFTGTPCPAGNKCRYSDSSFAQYNGNSTKLGGFRFLAHPSARGPFEGSITLRPAGSRFTIAGTGTAAQGQIVNKIGVTTGWTYGQVVATCADVNITGTTYTLLCQNIVTAGADHGDSGSPVFAWTKGNSVTLLGILWGGGTSNGQIVFAYSPFASVQDELGTLRVR
ncbi:MAG TPA: hypothetical protein VGG20_10410 [Thermoanaerobaculia bacterium]